MLELRLATITSRRKRRKKAKVPSSIFTHCLACRSMRLIAIGPDVQCVTCPWNSFGPHVDAGGADNFFSNFTKRKRPILVLPLGKGNGVQDAKAV